MFEVGSEAKPVEWFTGKSAIVTGAAHGIGRGIAELLAALGARVIAVDKDERALTEGLRDQQFVCCYGDLASEGTDRLAEDIWRRHGPIDLLVNNVGIETRHRFLELDEAEFDIVFHTNLRGPWFFTKQIAGHLVEERRTGAIVFVSSVHDTFIRSFPHYSASKAAVGMLVKELANDLAPRGIRVNAVSPGIIRTRYNSFTQAGQEALMSRHVPLGRIGLPADVARIVAVLLSDEWSGYVTGSNIRVDGGLALHSWTTPESGGPSRPTGRDRLARGVRRLKPQARSD
jgi:NAD(P)-dependent dehydrogenase (short-subunit alcohol dehydrogenase family)